MAAGAYEMATEREMFESQEGCMRRRTERLDAVKCTGLRYKLQSITVKHSPRPLMIYYIVLVMF